MSHFLSMFYSAISGLLRVFRCAGDKTDITRLCDGGENRKIPAHSILYHPTDHGEPKILGTCTCSCRCVVIGNEYIMVLQVPVVGYTQVQAVHDTSTSSRL